MNHHNHNHNHLHSKEYFMSFLIGMVVINLVVYILPEIFEESDIPRIIIGFSFILGIALQFVLHRFLSPSKPGNKFLTFLHVHNLTDGLTIGLATLVNLSFGVFTALAIMLHDIIHKIIGFSFLRNQGDTVKQALLKIAGTFLSIIGGVLLVLLLKPSHGISIMGGALAAGSLSYIVLSLLGEVFGRTAIIPHRYAKLFKLGFFVLGAIAMIILFMVIQSTGLEHNH